MPLFSRTITRHKTIERPEKPEPVRYEGISIAISCVEGEVRYEARVCGIFCCADNLSDMFDAVDALHAWDKWRRAR